MKIWKNSVEHTRDQHELTNLLKFLFMMLIILLLFVHLNESGVLLFDDLVDEPCFDK